MKIGGVIPVRLTSERLPGKALMDLAGRPVLYHLLDRVRACRFIASPKDVVVCTTQDSDDDALVAAVERYGASVFRGDRDDIIKRFRDAILHFGFDAVVQVDGDDPLTATEYMDLTMETLLSDPQLGIVWSEGLPLGVNCKSFRREAIERVFSRYQKGQNDTGFIYFFTKTEIVKKGVVRPVSDAHVFDQARLTLDYPEDLEMFRQLLDSVDDGEGPVGLDQVVSFLKDHPDVVAINAGLEEAYWKRTREKAVLSYRDDRGKTIAVPV